jgi:hypothetical protein
MQTMQPASSAASASVSAAAAAAAGATGCVHELALGELRPSAAQMQVGGCESGAAG